MTFARIDSGQPERARTTPRYDTLMAWRSGVRSCSPKIRANRPCGCSRPQWRQDAHASVAANARKAATITIKTASSA